MKIELIIDNKAKQIEIYTPKTVMPESLLDSLFIAISENYSGYDIVHTS